MKHFRAKQLGDYSIGKKLGSGKFSSVYLATNNTTKEIYAAKIIKKEKIKTEDDWIRIKREIDVLTRLDHPHIINMIEVFQTSHTMCIITDYVSGGDLYEYITCNLSKRIKPVEAFGFFRQMVSAMEYCHSRFVVHRDLKPENILITKDKQIKIADFGFARTFSAGNPMSTPCGSLHYAAPEVIAGRKYLGPSSDIWSLGCILYVMLVGSFPFKGSNNVETIQRIKEGRFIDSDYLINKETRDFLKKIFHPVPESRITLHEMSQHQVLWQGKTLLAMLIRPFAEKVYSPHKNIRKEKKEDEEGENITLRRSFSDSDLRSSLSKYIRKPTKNIEKEKSNIKNEIKKEKPIIKEEIIPILTKSNSQTFNKIIQLD